MIERNVIRLSIESTLLLYQDHSLHGCNLKHRGRKFPKHNQHNTPEHSSDSTKRYLWWIKANPCHITYIIVNPTNLVFAV